MELGIAEALVRRAMAQAALGAARGDAPFGAVLATSDGSVLLEAANAQATTGDPTAHAEIVLIRAAARELDRPMLEGLVLASNAESCSMCASALIKARVATIVFGAVHEGHMDPAIGLDGAGGQVAPPAGARRADPRRRVRGADPFRPRRDAGLRLARPPRQAANSRPRSPGSIGASVSVRPASRAALPNSWAGVRPACSRERIAVSPAAFDSFCPDMRRMSG